MRNLAAVALATVLFASNSFAADAPLAPGKPSGLTKAQDADMSFWYIAGLGAIAVGIAIVASSGASNPVVSSVVVTGTA